MTKEEAIKILQNIYFEAPEIKEALQIAIETLSRLSLPSNLDEAAEDHAFFAGQERLRERLLEWAKEKHADLTKKLEAQDDPVHWGQRNAFQQVIDKLNQM